MKDQEIEGRVYVRDIKKYLCQYKMVKWDDENGIRNREATKLMKYSKGYIMGQDVIPFIFENGSIKQF